MRLTRPKGVQLGLEGAQTTLGPYDGPIGEQERGRGGKLREKMSP